jgi:integrase
MRRVPLTDLLIRKLKPPASRQIEIFDAKAPGLSVRIGASGAKTFFLLYRIKGERKKRRGKLGRYELMSLKAARNVRLEKLALAATGIDPFADTRQATVDPSVCGFAACVDRFICNYVEPNSKAPTNAIRILRKEFVSAWGSRDVRTITKADVLTLLHGILKRPAPVAANRALARVRKLFNWLVGQDVHSLIEISPCIGIKRFYKESSRERVLGDEELAALWNAAESLGYPYGPLFKLLVILGQRRSEVAGMRWDEIEKLEVEGHAQWKIPSRSTKNGEPHLIPLPELAVKILKDCPRISGSPYVFPSAHHKGKHLTGYSVWKTEIDHIAGVSGWCPHDLRRTQASIAPALEISEVLIEQIHNHKLPKTQVSASGVVYMRYRYIPEMRAALNKYAAHVEKLAETAAKTATTNSKRRRYHGLAAT